MFNPSYPPFNIAIAEVLPPETTMTRIIVKTLVKIPARIMVNNGLYHVYPFNCLGYVIKSGYFSDI